MKKETLIFAILIIGFLSSCGPRRYGCGPRRCEIKTQHDFLKNTAASKTLKCYYLSENTEFLKSLSSITVQKFI
mgnify:CR=1 FL=1